MKHLCSFRLLVLLFLLPGLARAGTPVLTLRTTVVPQTGVDVMAFADRVEIIDEATGTAVAGAVSNAGFEGSIVGNWNFYGRSGLAADGSLSSPTPPEGTHVAFLQTDKFGPGSVNQTLPALANGTYRVRVQLAQRNTAPANQGVELLVDGVVLGSYTPANDGAFHAYTSGSTFSVVTPTLTFSPGGGRRGTVVTVTGTGLAAATAVTVNGVAGTILSTAATSLTFAVGVGSTTGPIVVSRPTGPATGSANFLVLPVPPCFEEVDTVSTPANGGYSLLMGTDPTAYPTGAPSSPGRGDDTAQLINLGFGFDFYGTVYTSCYINSNGSISFTRSVYEFTPQTFPTQPTAPPYGAGVFGPMIAPFWADVGNASLSCGRIWYKLYPDRLVVLWNRVGYGTLTTPARMDKKNTFQLILRRNTVVPAPEVDVTFVYGEIQWVAPAAAPADYASVGFDTGDNVHYYNLVGTRSSALLSSLPGTCIELSVGSHSPTRIDRSLTQVGITAIGPNPVGLGQEVTLTGSNLAGTSSAAVNYADATPSRSGNTATSLTLRVPPSASLSGVTTLTTGSSLARTNFVSVLPEPGNALAFYSTDNYVSVPHAPALNLTTALTLEAWVRTSASTEQYLVTKTEDSWYLAVNGAGGAPGKASFYLNGPSAAGGWLHGTTTLSDGHWHHVAGTYDGTTLKLYVDGKLESSRPATGAVATGTAPLLLGYRPSLHTARLFGALDEVRLWRTARSADELRAGLYQIPQQPAADLVAYFNFDRGTPGGDNRAYPTFFDAAGGALATLNNMSLTGASSNFVESYALVVPAGLSATAVTPTSFTLTWQNPIRGSVGSLVLDVSTSPTFATVTTYTLANTVTSQAVTGRVANTAYYYRLRADRIYGVTGQGAYASGSLTTPTTAATCGVSISGFSPASGSINSTVVTVSGAGFSAAGITAVTFGGTATTSFTVVNATTIQVTVPPGAVTGSLGLVTSCGSTSSAAAFTVSAPTLVQLSPAAELPGQTVSLTGTGFLPTSTVSFGGQPAAVTYVSPTQLQAVVPFPPVGYNVGYDDFIKATVNTSNGSAVASPTFNTLSIAVPGAVNACTTVPTVTNAADNNWHYLLSTEGQVVLAYNSQGRNLGTVGASYLLADPTQSVRRDPHGQYYLGRNWRLTTSAGPFAGSSVLVRYYGLASEFALLREADPDHAAALGNLRLTQYSGPNEDCALANNNNATGTSVLLTPTTTNYGPDGSNFFAAEAVVPNHFSEFYLGATPTAPLPVELSAFTATAEGTTAVRLAWATASEKNSAWFDVERSADGVAFARIGTVAAAGNSSTARSYELLDSQVPKTLSSQVPLYYRLKQLDADGAFRYSPVRTVVLPDAPAGLALFPNPAHGGAAILTGALPGTVVTVLDALGRPVATATADAAGTAALVLPAGLPVGVYVVRTGAKAVRLAVE